MTSQSHNPSLARTYDTSKHSLAPLPPPPSQALEGLAATVTSGTPVQILERKVVLLWTSLATNEHACELYVSDTYQVCAALPASTS